MAHKITLTSFSAGSDADDNNSFSATGTCNERAFISETILWQGEPIFKIHEVDAEGDSAHRKLADSEFSRGERIAVARFLKNHRTNGGNEVSENLNDLTVKELRSRAKAAGLKNLKKAGQTKSVLVARLLAA
tara:strand:- start:103 stop:498 length:396 start_codon:yes stop_codon:yes gene_type:complete